MGLLNLMVIVMISINSSFLVTQIEPDYTRPCASVPGPATLLYRREIVEILGLLVDPPPNPPNKWQAMEGLANPWRFLQTLLEVCSMT